MSFNLLKGKRGIIFGALNDASIAWKVAERAVEEGAQIVLTNTAVACRMGTIDELAKKTNATVIPADATSVEDLTNLFEKAQEAMGGKIDFVLHSCAMSVNMRKKRTYDDLDYSFLNKTLDISAISFHKMLQVAKKLDALSEGASVLALTYVASHRTFFGYNDMADAKSLLESIARSFGYIYGREKHVRINTISQSPTFTTAGSGIKGFDGLYDFSDRMSPLGNAFIIVAICMKAVHFEIFPKLCINGVLVFVVFVEIHQNGYWISRDCPSSRSDSETVFFCFISPIWKQ